MHAEAVAKNTITKYVRIGVQLEGEIGRFKRRLGTEGLLEGTFKEVRGQMFQVSDIILKYEKRKKASVSYVQTFIQALGQVSKKESEFVKDKVSSKGMDGITEWLSSYKKAVLQLQKSVGD